jgi:hypothetical protein
MTALSATQIVRTAPLQPNRFAILVVACARDAATIISAPIRITLSHNATHPLAMEIMAVANSAWTIHIAVGPSQVAILLTECARNAVAIMSATKRTALCRNATRSMTVQIMAVANSAWKMHIAMMQTSQFAVLLTACARNALGMLSATKKTALCRNATWATVQIMAVAKSAWMIHIAVTQPHATVKTVNAKW